MNSYSLVKLLIRRNNIGSVTNEALTSARAVKVTGCESAKVEFNVVSLDRASPIEHQISGNIYTLLNLSAAGVALQSTSVDTPPAGNDFDVTEEIEDAMLLAHLKL